ncbi:MAG: NFACT family protein, partial [Candidatus Methanoplasma sp.]|nr:NFACT family protein [Candidatus Methanoplasma sp.]
MKKEMSSFDVCSIVSEMASLEGAHIDKVFHWGAGNVLFRLNVQGDGKRELFFRDKKWLYLAPERPDTPDTPTSFATFLRKYITNARVGKTSQAGFDRITVTEVFKSDAEYQLIFEMFGGGNVLLVLDGKIVNCLTHRTWKDRSTRPGEDYVMPKSRFDPVRSTFDDFTEIIRSSGSDTVRTLATAVNLGGQYSEEICKRAGIDKNLPSKDASDENLEKMYSSLREIMEHVVRSSGPTVFRKDGAIIDVAPVDLTIYDHAERQAVPSMSLAIDSLMKEIGRTEEEAYVDPEIEKLKKRIQKQEETIDEYRMESEDLKGRADAVYIEYQKINELLTVLGQKSKELTWEKLAEGARKIPFVLDIDPSKNIVAAEVSGLRVS